MHYLSGSMVKVEQSKQQFQDIWSFILSLTVNLPIMCTILPIHGRVLSSESSMRRQIVTVALTKSQVVTVCAMNHSLLTTITHIFMRLERILGKLHVLRWQLQVHLAELVSMSRSKLSTQTQNVYFSVTHPDLVTHSV